MYIPLYGKALVSRMGVILDDPKAEEIWEKEGFALRGKSRSRYLAYYMAMRAGVFDRLVSERLAAYPQALVVHLGCGMDSRCLRVKKARACWADVDMGAVISERRRHYEESGTYRMIAADARETAWIQALPEAQHVVLVMEGLTMYLSREAIDALFAAFAARYAHVHVLADFYTTFGVRASRYKNPISDVGAQVFYGMDDPRLPERTPGVRFAGEESMTPPELVAQLKGMERLVFSRLMAGRFAKKIYRLWTYEIEGKRAADEG